MVSAVENHFHGEDFLCFDMRLESTTLTQLSLIFQAHSRPLVNQQIDACYQVVAIPEHDTCELTGKSAKSKRIELWNSKRVFFATPQVIQNDISDPSFPTSQIKLIIVDEVSEISLLL